MSEQTLNYCTECGELTKRDNGFTQCLKCVNAAIKSIAERANKPHYEAIVNTPVNEQRGEISRKENTLIASQEMNILEFLKKNHPTVFTEQKHLDEGTAERAYWHYGRWGTLRDLRKNGEIATKRESVVPVLADALRHIHDYANGKDLEDGKFIERCSYTALTRIEGEKP